MDATTKARWGAAALIIAPLVIWAGFIGHPDIGDPLAPGAIDNIATAVAADSAGWALAHLSLAVGSGLLALAFVGLRGYLRDAGEDTWSAVGLPFVIFGSVLFALLPAMEMAPVAAADAGLGHDGIAAVQVALEAYFPAVLMIGSAIFAVGAVAFAVAVPKSGVLSPGPAKAVAGLLVVVAASRFIPLAIVLFHVQSVALIAALFPLAYVMWTRPTARPTGQARPATTA